ncbi:helix-hairpin-helix domain-containing protein [Compostibacter hankyongensis]|uniref:Helix-hairpin-helix domain-containing protein n=1 Tax=Compostibacter hankyongensis TaxID=1007089 RepID=A0ABP8G9W1_9BACT
MDNKTIASRFTLLSRIMEIHGENTFKTRAYSTAAFQLERAPLPLSEMPPEDIARMKSIGPAIAQKIQDLLQTGRLPLLEQYLEKTPPGILEMLSIKGIGPKKIATIWKTLGIETPGELLYACTENRLLLYKGFGAKTQENIRQAITFYLDNQGLQLYGTVAPAATLLLQQLRDMFPNAVAAWTGAFRRQAEILDQLEIVISEPVSVLQDRLKESFQQVTLNGDTLLIQAKELPPLHVHSCSPEQFARTLFFSTGPEPFITAFQQQFPEAAAAQPDTEAVFFQKAGLPDIAPALRDRETILADAAAGPLPQLIRPEDIRGIVHAHTQWSDGADTLEAMATAARDKGYEYLVVSDHSRSAFYANGLQPERIRAQHEAIDELNEKLAPFRLFKSIEADILPDGQLDYPDDILATFDLVIASVHSNLKMDEQKAMQRLLRAVEHPFTTILGHPTGRLLLSRPGYPVDHHRLIEACAAHHVVLEINAHPRRLDVDWRWIPYALEKGVLLSVDPDAHSIDGMELVRYGVLAAQKGGLSRERNLSSFSLPELTDFLRTQRQQKQG